MSTGDGETTDDSADIFGYGEWVEFKLNTDVFGIVVGSDCKGLRYDVQLSPSGQIVPFFGVTLRPLEDSDEYEPGGGGVPVEESNVIDFTKARELRAGTKTRERRDGTA